MTALSEAIFKKGWITSDNGVIGKVIDEHCVNCVDYLMNKTFYDSAWVVVYIEPDMNDVYKISHILSQKDVGRIMKLSEL